MKILECVVREALGRLNSVKVLPFQIETEELEGLRSESRRRRAFRLLNLISEFWYCISVSASFPLRFFR